MLEAVIFDMDGVIIDSEPMHAKANIRALNRLGLAVDWDCCYRFIGTTNRKMMEILKEEFHSEHSVDTLLSAAEAAKQELLKEEGYPEVPHVLSMIHQLFHDGLTLAIASSSPMENIEDVLTVFGVRDCFSLCVSGTQVANPKPAPDVFLLAADQLGIAKEKCIIIEDSENGVKAAKAAGIRCLGFQNPNSGSQDLSLASKIITSFEGITKSSLEA